MRVIVDILIIVLQIVTLVYYLYFMVHQFRHRDRKHILHNQRTPQIPSRQGLQSKSGTDFF